MSTRVLCWSSEWASVEVLSPFHLPTLCPLTWLAPIEVLDYTRQPLVCPRCSHRLKARLDYWYTRTGARSLVLSWSEVERTSPHDKEG